jgi:hypothetical protein
MPGLKSRPISGARATAKAEAGQKQIPRGNDRKKSNSNNGKNKSKSGAV